MLRHPSRRLLKLRCATWFLALLVLGLVLTPASRAAYDPDRNVYQLPDETGGIETGGDPDGVGLDNSPPEEDPPFAPDPDGTLNPFERNLGDWLEILAAVFRTTI